MDSAKHKALEIEPVFIEFGLGSEGNAFDGSPSIASSVPLWILSRFIFTFFKEKLAPFLNQSVQWESYMENSSAIDCKMNKICEKNPEASLHWKLPA